ncbi:MAG: NUDIX domain-containing protein [bacterium]|nr:NUDIX domain-containing protein [bacterium]
MKNNKVTNNSLQEPRVGIAVLIWKDDRLLMYKRIVVHGNNTWSVPGGHLESGESWEECAKRETAEEAGIFINNLSHFATTNDIFDSGKHYVTIWMNSDWESGEVQILEPDKCIDFQWVDIADLPQPLFEQCWTNLKKIKPELFKISK